METTHVLSPESRQLAGILLIALVTVESGGLYLLKIVRGNAATTPFQLALGAEGNIYFAVSVRCVVAGFTV